MERHQKKKERKKKKKETGCGICLDFMIRHVRLQIKSGISGLMNHLVNYQRYLKTLSFDIQSCDGGPQSRQRGWLQTRSWLRKKAQTSASRVTRRRQCGEGGVGGVREEERNLLFKWVKSDQRREMISTWRTLLILKTTSRTLHYRFCPRFRGVMWPTEWESNT